jgi:hypothetical protein
MFHIAIIPVAIAAGAAWGSSRPIYIQAAVCPECPSLQLEQIRCTCTPCPSIVCTDPFWSYLGVFATGAALTYGGLWAAAVRAQGAAGGVVSFPSSQARAPVRALQSSTASSESDSSCLARAQLETLRLRGKGK